MVKFIRLSFSDVFRGGFPVDSRFGFTDGMHPGIPPNIPHSILSPAPRVEPDARIRHDDVPADGNRYGATGSRR